MRRRLTALALPVLLLASSVVAGCEAASPIAPQEAPSQAILRDVIGDVGLLDRLVLMESHSAIRADSVSALIGPAGGTIHIPGGHRIDFPAGAVERHTLISAAVGGTNVVKITFSPHGLKFPTDRRPTLTMSYDLVEARLIIKPGIVYVDRGDRILEAWPTLPNLLSRTASAMIGHFSSYALASN